METDEDAALTVDQEVKIAIDAMSEARWRLFRAAYKLNGGTYASLFNECSAEASVVEKHARRVRREYRKELRGVDNR